MAKRKLIVSDMTVLDNKTKLMWVRDGNIVGKAMTWNNAVNFIKSLNEQRYAGYFDWRLPNREEVETLLNFAKCHGFTGNLDIFFNEIGFQGVQTGGYWSSTTDAGSTDYAWGIGMYAGLVGYYYKTFSCHVLPVRVGQ